MTKVLPLSELWERTCQDQQVAYELLYQQLFPELQRYLFQMAKDKDLTSDLLQDLFIKIWLRRENLGAVSNIRAYFYSSCRTMYINYYRKQQRQLSHMAYFQLDEREQSIEDKILSSEDDQHLHSQLLNAIEKLPYRQKEMVRMRFFKELEYERISDITGLKYQSVVNHIYRAVRLMRTDLKVKANAFQIILPIHKTFTELNQAS